MKPQKLWIDKRLVPVKRVGVEYVILEDTEQHPKGQLFIGYAGGGERINVVRWVPGMHSEKV